MTEQSMLTVADAERITNKIMLRLETIADNTEVVLELIEQAKSGEAHQALGYPSWTAYVADKFGGALGRLEKAERQPVAATLAEQGMSIRGISSITGASKSTTAREVSQGGTPEPADPGVPAPTPSEHVADPAGEKTTTGLDGKQYSRPEPTPKVPESRKRRRRPITDQYRDAVDDLRKALEKLGRLHADDRFSRAASALQERNRGWLAHLRSALDSVCADLEVLPEDTPGPICRECRQKLALGPERWSEGADGGDRDA